MEEYGKRYMNAKKQFLELMDKNCNGNYPINGATLSDDVIQRIIFDASFSKNNFDLLLFLFLNFSQYESFHNFIDSFKLIFTPQIPYDSCYFVYCLLKHINVILEREADVININNLYLSQGGKVTLNKMLVRDRISLQNILNFDYKFKTIFDRSLVFINCFDDQIKKDFIGNFPYFIYPQGFDNLLFFKLLGAFNFYAFGCELNSIYNPIFSHDELVY